MNRPWTTALAIAALVAAGCASDSENTSNSGEFGDNGSNGGGASNDGSNASSNNGGIEQEVEFGFSRPAVVGGRVFVANADLNSVAAIDAETARITTIPVGFAPTKVVGPTDIVEDGSIFVLNEGASTVSVIGPDLSTQTFKVGRAATSLAGAPDGSAAVAWFRPSEQSAGSTAGDLSSVNLVTPAGSFQLAVGFNVLDATFTEDSGTLLVTTADGVSVIDVAEVEADAIAPPIAVLPAELEPQDPLQRETILSPDGRWALARVFGLAGLALTDLESGEQWFTELPEDPTDIDWIDGDTPRVTANLRTRSQILVATIPDGFVAGSELPVPTDIPVEMDAGMPVMDAGTDSGMAGTDAGMDAGMALPNDGWLEADGFDYIDLTFENLGLTEVGRTAQTALIYTSITNDGRALLLDLETLEQRQVPFEKGIVRVESDDDGRAFVVIHDRVAAPQGSAMTPGDDAFIRDSHGLSVLDVASGASRLTLTEQEPQQAVLWSEGDDRVLYVAFAPENPTPADFDIRAKRALASIDLRSLALERTLLPSLPNGLGTIPTAGKVFISQIHPQGRITFVDVGDGTLRTVTGFQLNAGID